MDLMVQQVCISNPTLQASILLFSRLSNSSTLLSSNKKGVCLSSSECTSEGGKTIDGAGRIVEAWPGRIRRVYCARGCRCGEGSDHCCGKATDMMCSDAGGAATLAGRKVAEWVVRNRDELRLGYVIWGQKIWHVKKDKEMGWDRWRTMDDREDVTQNHW